MTSKLILIFFLLLTSTQPNTLFSQRTDSTMHTGGITGDTMYIIHENIPENKFWGNSWYTGLGYTLSTSHEFTFNFGRTYGSRISSGAGFNVHMRSWGITYSYLTNNRLIGHTAGAFAEVSNFYLPPGTARMDYIFDLTNGIHYLRPSIGLNLGILDVMYSYSFKIYGKENLFKHGLILRLKYFINTKHWEHTYPRHY